MGRLTPKTNTLKALFAKSGNQCAFPGCDHPMINKKNQFIGQVCHIESALPGGERFNKESNDEFRRCYDCLLYTSPSPRDGLLSRMPSSA